MEWEEGLQGKHESEEDECRQVTLGVEGMEAERLHDEEEGHE